MKKRLLASLLVLALLSGCAPVSEEPLQKKAATTATELTVMVPADPHAARTPQADRAVAVLGLGLLRSSREAGRNTMVSPLSAALCLSMAANGGLGETLEQLLALLGDGCTLADLNANCASLMNDYGSLGSDTVLKIANSLWLENGFQAEDIFLRDCWAIYTAQAYAADFRSPEAVKAVNAWVSDHTGGMIKKLLEEFPQDTAALLLNALYLDAKWETPFSPDDTREDWFYVQKGPSVKTDFMHSVEDNLYFAADGAAGVVLPYKDGRLGFLAVLPEEGTTLTEYLDGWDGNTLDTLLAAAGTRKVSLNMPKFKAEWSGDLTDTLKALGVTDAFDPARADFSALGVTAEGDPVFLSQVLQKTAIDVSEQGVKAAAVTGIRACGGAPAPVDDVILTLDRPFVYAVMDLERGVPLFLGTYEAP